LLPIPILPTRR